MCSLAKSGEDHDFGPDMQFSGGASDHVAAWKEVQKVLAESDQDFDLQVAVFFTDGGKTQNYLTRQKLVSHLIMSHVLVWLAWESWLGLKFMRLTQLFSGISALAFVRADCESNRRTQQLQL